MIRDLLEASAIGAFIAMIALWSGLASFQEPPKCRAGSVPAIFTNCEVIQ